MTIHDLCSIDLHRVSCFEFLLLAKEFIVYTKLGFSIFNVIYGSGEKVANLSPTFS